MKILQSKNINSRKIVIINQATGYLTIDIVNHFNRHHEFSHIALIAGSVRVQDFELDKEVYWSKIIKYNRGNFYKKLASWIIGTFQIYFLLITKYRKFEVFFISIPPLAYLLTYFLRNKFAILIYDLFPNALSIYGIRQHNFVYRKWAYLNRIIFPKAYKIFTISEGLRKEICAYCSRDHVSVVPNWSGISNLVPINKSDNRWLIDKPFAEKFIIQYSGNIGSTHNVEVLVQLAVEFKFIEGFHFLIIGRGDRQKKISDMIVKNDLLNCTVMPYQPDELLQHSLSAADISVVVLDSKVSNFSLPSKLYNLLAVGAVIMGICSEQSELYSFINDNEIGRAFSENEIHSMKDFIQILKNDSIKLNQYKTNSLSLSKKFTHRNAEILVKEYLFSSRKIEKISLV